MNSSQDAALATLHTDRPFNLRPLLLANMACTMAMMAFVSLIGPIARVLGLATWQAGAAVTVSGVIWMLLARPWGQASDRLGRRRVLLLGTGGFTLAYWALCVFIDASLQLLPSAMLAFIGLILGRGLIGVFYAAIPVGGYALVADNIEPEHRAKAMASLGAANACGLVLGPAIAALLARHSLSLPFYAMAVLPLLGFLAAPGAAPQAAAQAGQPLGPTPASTVGGGVCRDAVCVDRADNRGFFRVGSLEDEPGRCGTNCRYRPDHGRAGVDLFATGSAQTGVAAAADDSHRCGGVSPGICRQHVR